METSPIINQSLPAGTRLEQFVIERVLGSGGFGVTYLATDSRLNRQVVIKENLPAQFCFRDPGTLTVAPRHSHGDDAENFRWSLENFSKEAAMLASLDHPGIVRVLHSFEAFGTAYFVMPFVEGKTFDELVRQIERKPFTEKELRGLLDRVLSALGHLHQRSIYHRDIKPGNILITNGGVPVLIDFGSARQRLSERSMTVVESAGYTPFEQLQSRGNVGPWSDLYALGATLVKAITGDAPPKAADRAFDDPYQPLATRQMLSNRFAATFLSDVDRALQMRPQDRWQNAGEWKAYLHQPKAAKAELPAIKPKVEVAAAPQPVARAVKARMPMPAPAVEERDFLLDHQTPIRMCWIPPGQFMMGSPEDELGRQDDEVRHHVTLSKGFWMGMDPVTQLQWQSVMGSNPSHFIGEDLPVENVSWQDICSDSERSKCFLNRINATAPGGMRFDLPTEAEWEYACRAGTETAIHSGSSLTTKDGECPNLNEVAWYHGNSGGKTHPVGRKKPNAWGLYDMHGNVWEWCSDWFGSYPCGEVTDPTGPDTESAHIRRGGGWLSIPAKCRSAFRGISLAGRYNWLGFRLVLRNVA
jgi:formylglycine-generating enzyme required for sulfatase activity/predicted Ser/Thr protein kinase